MNSPLMQMEIGHVHRPKGARSRGIHKEEGPQGAEPQGALFDLAYSVARMFRSLLRTAARTALE